MITISNLTTAFHIPNHTIFTVENQIKTIIATSRKQYMLGEKAVVYDLFFQVSASPFGDWPSPFLD